MTPGAGTALGKPFSALELSGHETHGASLGPSRCCLGVARVWKAETDGSLESHVSPHAHIYP